MSGAKGQGTRPMLFEEYRVGAVVGGALRLERLVALGGGGAVFEATSLRTGAKVAVKVLRPGHDGSDGRRYQRFLREARAAMRLRSPHAVRIHDTVTPPEGPPYLVMEYLDGETLADRQRRSGPLPIPDAVDWILQAIEPLAEMHAAGIIHRDVKPSNLFLIEGPGGEQRIKLLDFGIVTPDPATEIDAELTQTDSELGTPLYMAPEQFLDAKHVDARADVWSLGVTLFQLVAGRMPFQAPTVAGLSLRILYDEPEPLGAARPEVPPRLAEVVMQCLEKDPARRIADVATLAARLAPFAGHAVERDTDADATLPLAPASGDAAPEEPDTLEASFESPPRPAEPLVTRGRALRAAGIVLGGAVWLWMLASIGQQMAPPPRATAAPPPEVPPAGRAEPHDHLVAPPSSSEASARPPALSPHLSRPSAVRPVPRRAAPRPSPPAARSAPTSDSVDDRIW